jgi:hypothetical protein
MALGSKLTKPKGDQSCLSCYLASREGRPMSKKYIPLIYNTPPEGFAWKIMKERKVLKSGTARTQAEANAAAERAARELEDADRE